ncbi:MAG: class I SAM-dependent methyltransferase [Rhodospirillales bacterium]|jgi:ubiquinone/menaquinone biosynthesis C-methylase UbiE|nr:class I SAM-dependent methyltransferase [Rhodospirillales bacterium]
MTKFKIIEPPKDHPITEDAIEELYSPVSEYDGDDTVAPKEKTSWIPSLNLYRHFLDGKPEYLVRHYWWAYLWPFATWFFDHQPIINAILFGQYKKLMRATMARLDGVSQENVLQLTCVYGELTPKLIETVTPKPLHITDVATVQLELAKSKAPREEFLLAARMNAEQLAYKDDCFSTVVLFFLLHEMPEQARFNVLSECMRVIPTGGTLLVTEYAPLPTNHILYRFAPCRWLITKLEPFLDSFWHTDVAALLNMYGKNQGKKVSTISDERIFANFYRVTEYKVLSL